MSEKDIKTKPKSTTKAVQNAPKSVSRSPAETVKDMTDHILFRKQMSRL